MSVTGESRLLIDGKLVERHGRAHVPNVNPATEEVIGAGRGRDARGHGPRDRRGAARLRRDRLVHQPRRAREVPTPAAGCARKQKEELRRRSSPRSGTPIMLTYAVQQDTCIDDMLWDIECVDRSTSWEHELGVHEFFGSTSKRLRAARADRRRRR